MEYLLLSTFVTCGYVVYRHFGALINNLDIQQQEMRMSLVKVSNRLHRLSASIEQESTKHETAEDDLKDFFYDIQQQSLECISIIEKASKNLKH